MSRSAALLTLFICSARPCLAQLPFEIRGYYLNVGLWSDSTAFNVGGLDEIQRVRLMTGPHLGPLDLEVAYEHTISYSERPGSAGGGGLLGVIVPGGGEWLDLEWTVAESENLVWTHRFDRLSARYAPGPDIEITAGRQTISWATTRLLTPADPFIPFDPSDPFQEFRAGVDALRAQAFPNPLSELELVLRPADTPVGQTLTLLGRGRTALAGWDLSAWAGRLHDGAAGAVAAAGAVGATAVRGELSLREEDGLALRGTLGLDRRFSLSDRDLYVVVEYEHDDFGAKDAGGLPGVLASDPFARGELQVLGRDELAAEASYQVHPLIGVDLLSLWNLRDGSALLAPGASYSLSNEATARAGAFFGLGRDIGRTTPVPQSEYGIVPTIGYLSISLYF